jgi:WD40 repeat protein
MNIEETCRFAGHADFVLGVDISPDGRFVGSCDDAGAIHLWEAATGRAIGSDNLAASAYSVAFSPDGQRLVAAGMQSRMGGGEMRVYSIPDFQLIARLRDRDQFYSARFVPESDSILCGSFNGAIIWQFKEGPVVGKLLPSNHSIRSVSISGKGDLAITGGSGWEGGGTFIGVRVWNLGSRSQIKQLPGHKDTVRSVCISSEGKYALSGGDDNSLRLWDIQAGQELGHTDLPSPVLAVAFSPDSTVALSGGYDGCVRLWRTTPWESVAQFAHGQNVYGLAFAADGRNVATASKDQTVRLLQVLA